MKKQVHNFKPYSRLTVPVFNHYIPSAALHLAACLSEKVNLVGVVMIGAGAPVSHEAASASHLRQTLQQIRSQYGFRGAIEVIVSDNLIPDLTHTLSNDLPDLLVLEWSPQDDVFHPLLIQLTAASTCATAIVSHNWDRKIERILVPLRGGPYAEEALRLSIAVSHSHLEVLHITHPSAAEDTDTPFRGLSHILPRLTGVEYTRLVSDAPFQAILDETRRFDLMVMGASSNFLKGQREPLTMVERLLQHSDLPVVVVKTGEELPQTWTGPEGERAGTQAISLLVDHWFAENTYHADEFDDLNALVALKEEKGVTISLALPALNEEETVGNVIQTVKAALMDKAPLLDEIVLLDSNSTDRTRQIASDLGIPVYIHQELLPSHGARRGKGEALWKSLAVTRGDILVWIDTDVVNIHPRFVYGVIGPMLVNPRIQFVKGFYQRPLRSGDKLQAGQGGRVTELTARPLLNLFYPELSGIIQPLSGEYGGRRSALEQLPFSSGYGVEIGLLIDIFERFGLQAMAQVNLLERIHHNQPLEALTKMSFVILQTVLRKLEARINRPLLEEVNKTMKLVRYTGNNYFLDVEEVLEQERPPMINLPEYKGLLARREA